MSLPIDLTDKRALVTGVSSGIGLGIAAALAQAGCDVAGCGLDSADSSGADAFRQAVSQHGRAAHYHPVDVTDDAQLLAWVSQAAEQLGGIDYVISNAGYSAFHGAADCSPAQWERALALNLTAHWKLAHAARPYLLEASEPVIVVITSNHAYSTIPGCFPYNVAKGGLLPLVQSLAIEWGPQVRAVGIAPGFIDTPAAHVWFNSFDDPAAERARTEARHPVGRLGTPHEIGTLCAYLCSPYSRFITGTTILVDGGRSALMQDM
jgi:NAD(P)-dependent dehydrogenase (short-subunit alcohol dehydrogenase family)